MTGTSFASLAKAEADRRGWSVGDLARLARVPAASAYLAVNGYDVRLSTALKVATALELPVGVLGNAGDLK